MFFLYSCSKNNAKVKSKKFEEATVIKETTSILNSKPTLLNSNSKKVINNWAEYQNIIEFLPNYYKTTTKQALFNSQRLAELSQQLKDSIRVEKLDIPSFRARLNVLYTIAFRLADMDSIPSITDKEVINETKNIVNAFDAINIKINMLVSQGLLEDNLREFDSVLNRKDSVELELRHTVKKNGLIKERRLNKKRIKPINLNQKTITDKN